MHHFWKKFFNSADVIHLDYASTTPVAKEVFSAMKPYFSEVWANPSAVYTSGVRARRAVEDARKEVARILHVRPDSVLFTSGGTESNNHALIGTIEALHTKGEAYEEMEIITTEMEHPSILETCEVLRARGVSTRYVKVDAEGLVDEKDFASALSKRTVLVTFAYVNSEVGVVQQVKRLTRLVRAFNTENDASVLVHLDASQAPLWLSCEMDMLGVDLMTLDAGKCYGPKGVGILARRHGVALAPFMYGGGQEGGLRSSTENVPLVVGCSTALLRAQRNWSARSEAVSKLRDTMIELIEKEIPSAILNGSRTSRVANNINVSIPGIDSEYAVITLDAHGVAVSTKSACGSKSSSGSYVVRAMTGDEGRATSTIRFTLGEETSKEEILRTLSILKKHIEKMEIFNKRIQKPIV
jgi:cysteine desulfurase